MGEISPLLSEMGFRLEGLELSAGAFECGEPDAVSIEKVGALHAHESRQVKPAKTRRGDSVFRLVAADSDRGLRWRGCGTVRRKVRQAGPRADENARLLGRGQAGPQRHREKGAETRQK